VGNGCLANRLACVPYQTTSLAGLKPIFSKPAYWYELVETQTIMAKTRAHAPSLPSPRDTALREPTQAVGGRPVEILSGPRPEPRPAGGVGAAAIAAQLRRAILEGAYSFRERLPAERELATFYAASRSTIREALRQLEEMQLVTRRVGSGTFVAYRGEPTDTNIADLTSPLEVIEVRFGIEPHMASLAVMHATARDLERLAEALKAVEAAGTDVEAFTRADALFHLALAECTRNPLLIWLYRHINEVRSHAQWSAMKDKILTPERVTDYNQQHRQLYQAIAARDRAGAVAIITHHLELAHNDLVGARSY